MSEEEAKKRWCPFVRAQAPDEPGAANRWDRDPFDGPTNTCIASACMAWRVAGGDQWLVTYDGQEPALWDWDPTNHPDYGPKVKVEKAVPHGFCGLAGAPQ